MRMTTRLRAIMRGKDLPYGAAAYDGLTSKLVSEAGFDFILAAGGQIAASFGLPDAELYSMTENLQATRRIVASGSIPVIADCDTGYGNAINLMRTVREFEQIGVAGLLLEDQVVPKRCPAMADPEIISIEEGVGKIRAAVAARVDPDLVIIARSDATDVVEACSRLKAYAAAGADMVFTINRCAKSYDDLRHIREVAGVPMLIHLMGWVEQLSEAERRSVAGCAFFGFPTVLTVAQAMRLNLATMHRTKSTAQLPVPTMTLHDFEKFIGFPQIAELQREYIP